MLRFLAEILLQNPVTLDTEYPSKDLGIRTLQSKHPKGIFSQKFLFPFQLDLLFSTANCKKALYTPSGTANSRKTLSVSFRQKPAKTNSVQKTGFQLFQKRHSFFGRNEKRSIQQSIAFPGFPLHFLDFSAGAEQAMLVEHAEKYI